MVNYGRLSFLIAAVLLGTGMGCSGKQENDGEVSRHKHRQQTSQSTFSFHQDQIFRGYAVFGHEVRAIRLCGSDDALWAVDRAGSLWDLHKELAILKEPYQGVFVVVRGKAGPAPDEGFGMDYTGGLTVDEVLYAVGEGYDCEDDWDEFYYRAYGNEPFWSAEISARGIIVTIIGEPDQTWTEVREQHSQTEIRFTGVHDSDKPIHLTIVREPCRDSMSGAYFGMSARLTLETEEFEGCALFGSNLQKP